MNIETYTITEGQIEILWFYDQDEESRISEFDLNENEVLKALEETNTNIDEWVEAYKQGALFYDFKYYATDEQIKQLLTNHLNK